MTVVILATDSVLENATSLATLHEILLQVLCEPPLAGSVDLLAASDLVLGPTQSFEGELADLIHN